VGQGSAGEVARRPPDRLDWNQNIRGVRQGWEGSRLGRLRVTASRVERASFPTFPLHAIPTLLGTCRLRHLGQLTARRAADSVEAW